MLFLKYKHRSKAAAFMLLLTLTLILTYASGCRDTIELPVSIEGYKLNTYVTIKAYTSGKHNKQELSELLDETLNICDRYELLFSRTNSKSTLYKVNNGECRTIPYELAQLIQLGIDYGKLSDGAFDISIGSVSSLWDFTADKPVAPNDGDVKSALKYVDYTRIKLTDNNDGTFEIDIPEGMIIDLGAIAKGYIADRLRDFLIQNGIDKAIINLGGNVLCVGQKDDNSNFLVSIKKPFSDNNKPLEILSLNNKSAVSSGTYERYFYENDTLYHHILNPHTGYPYENNLSGVTIISDLSVTGDCLSTTCFALGLTDGMALIENTPGVEALFVTNDGQVHYSSGFSAYIK